MLKNKTVLKGFAVVLLLSMSGLAAASITAIRTVKPLSEWLSAVFSNPNAVLTSTVTGIDAIPSNHWVVIGLFGLSAATSAVNYIALQHRIMQDSRKLNLAKTGDA